MVWLKLTKKDGKDIIVNMTLVLSIIQQSDGTLLQTETDTSYIKVTETPAQIETMLKNGGASVV